MAFISVGPRLTMALLSLGCLFLNACTTVEGLASSKVDLAGIWHAKLPHDGKTDQLLTWWNTFNDPALMDLLAMAEASSPTLETAKANIEKARATLDSSRSGLVPSLTGSASLTRSGTAQSATAQPPSTSVSGGLDASWEIDLFNKNRSTVRAAEMRLSEEKASWHDARVTLAADVADYYVQYRACRQLEASYRLELSSEQETLKASQMSFRSGLSSDSDLALVRASVASASSTLTSQVGSCEILIKSLAQTVGRDESAVTAALKKSGTRIPTPANLKVNAVPADVLRQRPDVSALEYELAAASAEIDEAKAKLLPSLTLSGSISLSQTLTKAASFPWSFGPSLDIPLFDGGQRLANVRSYVAAYNSAVASYKSGVLSAVNEVETALVNVNVARSQISDLQSAAQNYRAYFKAIDTNWKAGGASLLDRETARRNAQSAEISLIQVRRDAVRYWIALYKALGGGWQPETDQQTAGPLPHKGDIH